MGIDKNIENDTIYYRGVKSTVYTRSFNPLGATS